MNKKFKRIFEIVVISILFVMTLFACSSNKAKVGHFELRDGEETFIYDGQVVINRLVNVDGKLYYLDENGHKVKDEWAIIDNDGHYGYFGNFGDLVKNKIRTIDGYDYYFDENGVLYQDRTESKIKVIDGVEYIANKNGELTIVNNNKTIETAPVEMTNKNNAAVNSSTQKNQKEQQKQTKQPAVQQQTQEQQVVQQTTQSNVASNFAEQAKQQAVVQQAPISTQQSQQVSQQQTAAQQNIQQTTQQQITQQNTQQTTSNNNTTTTNAPFANAIDLTKVDTSIPDEFGGPGVVGFQTTTSQKTSPGGATIATEETTTQASNEVKIVKTETIEDYIDGDDYSCTITLLKPIMNGSTAEETDAMNGCIEDIMDSWFDEISGIVSDYDVLPKSVTFRKATLGTVSKKKINITIEGAIKPKSGSSKAIKYRIVYDRESENADITKVNG